MVQYEGLFFDDKEIAKLRALEKNSLCKKVSDIHCTFKFLPKGSELFDEIVGSDVVVLVSGYGSSENNSGFKLILPEEIEKYYINYDKDGSLKVPHITTSLSEVGKAKDTKDLNFRPLDEMIALTGKMGYYCIDKEDKYISFEPVLKNSKVYKK